MSDVPLLEDVAVVVVNFGRPHLLREALQDLTRCLPPERVVIVDNHSTDAARTEVDDLCRAEGWTSVLLPTNTGFGVGCNLGAQAALDRGARYLLFLNPDATIDPGSVDLLRAAVGRSPLTVAAPVILAPGGAVTSAGRDLDLRSGEMRRVDDPARPPGAGALRWVTGACFLASAELWERIGGFDDDYFLYWEDVDLCCRVLAAGGRIEVVDGAAATHQGGATHTEAGARAKSETYYYFNIRNRDLFAAKWLSEADQRHWRRTSARAAWRVLLRGGRRQFLHPVGPLSVAWKGLRDGRRLARDAHGSGAGTAGNLELEQHPARVQQRGPGEVQRE